MGGAKRRLSSEIRTKLEDLHDAVAHGVAREIRNGVEVEFAHETRAMGFRGLDAKIQRDCDFLAGFSFGEKLDDLAFARGEHISGVRPFGNRFAMLFPIQISVEYKLTDAGREECSLDLQRFDGGNQVASGVGFEQVAA